MEEMLPADAVSLRHHQHLSNGGLETARNNGVLREDHLPFDLLLQIKQVLAAGVRIPPVEHLIQYNPQGPNIRLLSVLLPLENLRRHVERGPDHRLQHLFVILSDLRETKVSNLDPEVMQQQIGWL